MARVTSITCGVGAKVNQGNYESTDFTWSETITLEPGDDPVAVRADLHRRVHTIVERQVVAFRESSSDPKARAEPRRRAAVAPDRPPRIESDDAREVRVERAHRSLRVRDAEKRRRR